MIRRDDIHVTAHQLVPQRLLLVGATQRGRALGHRPEAFHVVFSEIEIVGAGLDGHVHAVCSRLGRHRDAAAGADVDNMQPGVRLLRQQQRALDRLELGEDRARVQECARGPRRDSLGQPARQVFALRVHGDRPAEPRRFPKSVE